MDKYYADHHIKPVSKFVMHRLSVAPVIISLLIVFVLLFPKSTVGQNKLEKLLAKKMDSLLMPVKPQPLLPDDAMQTITIPPGWGGYGSYLFGSIGGVYPQAYTNKADMAVSGGVCVGNPEKFLNFAASVNLNDVHKFQDFSANFIISRMLFAGTSVSAGVLQVFANKIQTDVPGETWYIAFSHAVQTLPSQTEGSSKLTYTIGIGNGRFYLRSPDDIAAGRNKKGTMVFGGVSYEVIHHVNLNAEWSGTNLAASLGLRPFPNAFSIGIGVMNITRNSADRPAGIFSIGYPLSLSR